MQKVHSKVQMRASVDSGGRSVSQHSQFGRSCSMTTPLERIFAALDSRSRAGLSMKLWGASIGFSAYGYCFYFFLTWLPGYLVQTMHMSILRSAGLAAIPWACATASDLLFGGWLIDHLIARGHDATLVRKSVLLFGMTCGLAVFGATTTTSPAVAVFWISIALSGLAAAAPVWWSIPALIAPSAGVGTMAGIMNFANNVMGAVAPIATGFIVGYTHSFAGAFLLAGGVLLVGMATFVLLAGRLESLRVTVSD